MERSSRRWQRAAVVSLATSTWIIAIGWAQQAPGRPELDSGESNWTAPLNLGPGLSTTNLNSQTPTDLVNALLGSGVIVTNITYSGVNIAGGTFSGGTGIIGCESGVVLSSGNIASVTGPNSGDGTTTNNGLGGDADLDALVPGFSTLDATVLEFDFECQGVDSIQFQYVFASEEYNEYVNTSFNDVFGFFLDGTNIALVPGAGNSPVSISNVNCNNPFAPPTGSNCNLYVNNDLSDGGGAVNTEMDGLTLVFTATSPVAPGVHHIKLALADAGDHNLDSNVFICASSFTCSLPVGACCDTDNFTCRENELEADCQGRDEVWSAGLTCADLDPPCTAPPTGSCCDVLTNTCQDDVVEDDCEGESQSWTEGTRCADCNSNSIPDRCEILSCGEIPGCQDCNENGLPDECDIASGESEDCDFNGVPDECGNNCEVWDAEVGNNLWSTAFNWVGDVVPGILDPATPEFVTLNQVGPGITEVILDVEASIDNLVIGPNVLLNMLLGNLVIDAPYAINNNGEVAVADGHSITAGASIQLLGSGLIRLLGPDEAISSTEGSTITSSTLINGQGIIDADLHNGPDGVLHANSAGGVLAVEGPGGKVNEGLMAASGGGIMEISIDVLGAGELLAEAGAIQLTSPGQEVLVEGSLLEVLGLGGAVQVSDLTALQIDGPIMIGQAGSPLASGSSPPVVRTSGTGAVTAGSASLTGDGSLQMDDTSSGLVQGSAVVGGGTTFALAPGGTLLMNDQSDLTVVQELRIDTAGLYHGDIESAATLQVGSVVVTGSSSDGGQMVLDGSMQMDSAAAIEVFGVDGGGSLGSSPPVVRSGGTSSLSGGSLSLTGDGSLQMDDTSSGLVQGSAVVGGGTTFALAPGGTLLMNDQSDLTVVQELRIDTAGLYHGDIESAATLQVGSVVVTGSSSDGGQMVLDGSMQMDSAAAIEVFGVDGGGSLGSSPPVVRSGGTSSLSGGSLSLTGDGSLQMDDTSSGLVQGSAVVGGGTTFALAPGGTLLMNDQSDLTVVQELRIDTAGLYHGDIESAATLQVGSVVVTGSSSDGGQMVLDGSMQMDSAAAIEVFGVDGGGSLGSSPPVVRSGGTSSLSGGSLSLTGDGSLQMDDTSSGLVQGSAVVGGGTTFALAPGGTLLMNDQSDLTVVQELRIDTAGLYHGDIESAATLQVGSVVVTGSSSDGGQMVLDGSMQMDSAAAIEVFGVDGGGSLGSSPPVVRSGGTSSLSGGSLSLTGDGSLQMDDTSSGLIQGSAAVGGGTNFALASAGTLLMNGQSSLSVGSELLLDNADLKVLDQSEVHVTGDLRILQMVQVVVSPGTVVTVGGDFDNRSTEPELFDWLNASLTLDGAGMTPQMFEAAGEHRGPWPIGLVDNFAIGTLELVAGTIVTMVDTFDNEQDGETACDEALYVSTLVLGPGATLIADGCPVYYGELLNNGGTLEGSIEDIRQVGDINDDGCVNPYDLAVLLGAWGTPSCSGAETCLSDMDFDGLVDARDLALLLSNWGCE